MRRKLLFAAVVLVLIVAGIAAWKYFERTDDLVTREPAASITASELIAAFDSDTARARQQYVNKILEITGTVTKIDSSAIEMGKEGSLSVVVVGMDERHLEDLQELTIGRTATIQGECTGYDKGSGDDLLAALGTTVQIKAAGVKRK